MDYFEKSIQQIKTYWFKDHKAEIRGEDGLQVIEWGKEGTSMYRVKYVLSGFNVFISGDLGEAVYCLTGSANLNNIKMHDLHYFTGKLTANSSSRWDFNADKARDELSEWYSEVKEDGVDDVEALEDLNNELVQATHNWTLPEHFMMEVYKIYESTSCSWFDSDEATRITDFGKELPMRIIAYWVGLMMAIIQLQLEEEVATC